MNIDPTCASKKDPGAKLLVYWKQKDNDLKKL